MGIAAALAAGASQGFPGPRVSLKLYRSALSRLFLQISGLYQSTDQFTR